MRRRTKPMSVEEKILLENRKMEEFSIVSPCIIIRRRDGSETRIK